MRVSFAETSRERSSEGPLDFPHSVFEWPRAFSSCEPRVATTVTMCSGGRLSSL